MKILVLVCSYPDKKNCNTSIFVHNQVKALKRANYDVDVMYIDIRSIRRKRKWFFSKYVYDGVDVYRYSIPCGSMKGLANIMYGIAVKKCFKKYVIINGKPDIVHAHFLNSGFCAYVLKKKFGQRYILTEHSSSLINDKISNQEKKYAKSSYQNADILIAVSSYLKSKMNKYTHKAITIIPNILPDYFVINNYPKKDIFTFLSIGNFVGSKRFDKTIEAFVLFHERKDNTQLLIFGDGVKKEKLVELVNNSGASEYIKINDRVCNKELPNVYNSCNVFVLPSEYETFGVVYIEALACGLPVIGTKCGGPNEMITKDNGIILEKECTSEQLADAMIFMYEKYDFYNREQISKNTINKYGEEAYFKKVMKVYEEVLKGNEKE